MQSVGSVGSIIRIRTGRRVVFAISETSVFICCPICLGQGSSAVPDALNKRTKRYGVGRVRSELFFKHW